MVNPCHILSLSFWLSWSYPSDWSTNFDSEGNESNLCNSIGEYTGYGSADLDSKDLISCDNVNIEHFTYEYHYPGYLICWRRPDL